MDPRRFNALVTRLAVPVSRRQGAALLGVLGLGALIHANPAIAGKKGKRKGKHRHKPKPQPQQPPAPVAMLDAVCMTGTGTAFATRQAQTFRAIRSGKLTSATVFLLSNTPGNDFDVEIWSVDQNNAPSQVLAGVTLANVGDRTGADPMRLTANFPAPATVVAGLRYALVVSDSMNGSYAMKSSSGNPCPDGMSFTATTANGSLTPGPSYDIQFETVVTA